MLKVYMLIEKVQRLACATSTKGRFGRSKIDDKAAAREARRAFFMHVVSSNFAYCGSGTGEIYLTFSVETWTFN